MLTRPETLRYEVTWPLSYLPTTPNVPKSGHRWRVGTLAGSECAHGRHRLLTQAATTRSGSTANSPGTPGASWRTPTPMRARCMMPRAWVQRTFAM